MGKKRTNNMLLCGFKLSEFFLTVRLLMAWSSVVSALSIGAFGADFGIDLRIALLCSEPFKVSSFLVTSTKGA